MMTRAAPPLRRRRRWRSRRADIGSVGRAAPRRAAARRSILVARGLRPRRVRVLPVHGALPRCAGCCRASCPAVRRARRGRRRRAAPTPGGRCGSRACSSGRPRSSPSLLFGLSDRAADFDPAGLTTPFGATGDVLAAPLGRWDSVWFLAIADGGYGDGAREAFFPLYPLLVQDRRRAVRLGADRRRAAVDGAARRRARAAAPARRARPRRAPSRATPCSSRRCFRCRSSSRRSTASRCFSRCRSARSTRRGASAGRGPALLGMLAATTRSAGVLLLVPLAMIYLWDVGAAEPARAAAAAPRRAVARRSCRSAWRCTAPCWRSTATTRSRRFDAQEVWFRSFAGPFVGAWDGARRRVAGRAPAAVGRARAGLLHGRGRRSVRRRAPQHRAVRLARARRSSRPPACCAGCPPPTAPTSWRRSRCRSPTRSGRSRSCRCRASSRCSFRWRSGSRCG